VIDANTHVVEEGSWNIQHVPHSNDQLSCSTLGKPSTLTGKQDGRRRVRWLNRLLEFVGKAGLFSLRVLTDWLKPPFEFAQLCRQLAEIGNKSLPLVVVSGFALGAVMTFHTRSTLVTLGATAMIPAVQSVSFFVEIGPLVAGLLLAGRVGSGIGAVLANMRASEQIDAIESLSIDSFKFLVVPRVLACVIALPFLTLFMDFAGLLGGFMTEELSSHIAPALYLNRAFDYLQWSNFIAPTLKTAVFGFIIGSVSSYFGYTTDKGAKGVGEAATNSVVVSSLLIIVADVVLIKCIFFLFPDTAI
jgi:phospholipid/cholesterol/gamma-HCH transport system permease protein